MTLEMRELIREIEMLVYKAETCAGANATLGHYLIDARRIVDRMQRIADLDYLNDQARKHSEIAA